MRPRRGDGFEKLFWRRQTFLVPGMDDKYKEPQSLSLLCSVGCSVDMFDLTTRFVNRFPSRKATSSSILSPSISESSKSTSVMSFLLPRSMVVIPRSNSSSFAVRRSPQIVDAQGMELTWDSVVLFRNCVLSETSSSWESSNLLLTSCWIKKTELLKATFCAFPITLNLFGRRFVTTGHMWTTLRTDKLLEGTPVNAEPITSSVLDYIAFAARSFPIKVSDKGELSPRRRQVKFGAISLCFCNSSLIHCTS